MHRFFIPKQNISADRVVLTPAASQQIRNVLRLKANSHIIVLDSTGYEFEVEIDNPGDEMISGNVLSSRKVEREPDFYVSLFISLTQREKFELVLQKCTEIGISEFHPFVSSRSLVDGKRFLEKKDRWITILREAAEQSSRGKIPILHDPVMFTTALQTASAQHAQVLFAWEEADLSEAIGKLGDSIKGQSIALFIGPEGGFSEIEAAKAQEMGAQVISLGKPILRMETAAIAAAFYLLNYPE